MIFDLLEPNFSRMKITKIHSCVKLCRFLLSLSPYKTIHPMKKNGSCNKFHNNPHSSFLVLQTKYCCQLKIENQFELWRQKCIARALSSKLFRSLA